MPLYYVWLLCKCKGDSEQKPLIWASLWLELMQQKHRESNGENRIRNAVLRL